MVFCDFCGARATLCGDRCKKSRFFADFCCSNWSSGVVSWFARLLPEPAGRGFDPRAGVARCNLHFKATCAEQLAQSKLHRATCADQLAPPCLEQLTQSNLRRATCTEQLAQSSLHRATCRERNLHRATCRGQLAGATCAEQLAQSNLAQCNLRRATCADQLAPTSLRRAPCLALSRACFTNASWREKERILQRCADLACDVMLSGQPWSSC